MKGDQGTDADGGAHVHEGLRLADGNGWVAVGDTNILFVGDKTEQVKSYGFALSIMQYA